MELACSSCGAGKRAAVSEQHGVEWNERMQESVSDATAIQGAALQSERSFGKWSKMCMLVQYNDHPEVKDQPSSRIERPGALVEMRSSLSEQPNPSARQLLDGIKHRNRISHSCFQDSKRHSNVSHGLQNRIGSPWSPLLHAAALVRIRAQAETLSS